MQFFSLFFSKIESLSVELQEYKKLNGAKVQIKLKTDMNLM